MTEPEEANEAFGANAITDQHRGTIMNNDYNYSSSDRHDSHESDAQAQDWALLFDGLAC